MRRSLSIRLVGAPGSRTTPATSTPSARILDTTSSPSSSSPTRPTHAAGQPSRRAPMATFDSAPATPSVSELACRNRPTSAVVSRAMVSPTASSGPVTGPTPAAATARRARSASPRRSPPGSPASPSNGDPIPTATAPASR